MELRLSGGVFVLAALLEFRPSLLVRVVTSVMILELVSMLGKHWRDTKEGAPFQCSPNSDHDFHVEHNEFPMTE